PHPAAPPKVVEAPKVAPTVAPPTVAPPAAELPSFDFQGGKSVETSTDPVQLYKGYVEYVLRQKWNRPGNLDDDHYVAEVQMSVDRGGRISDVTWEKGSGNAVWDESVRQALEAVQQIDRFPPTNFPSRFTVRFDVEQETEPIMQ
ncbi:MAG TPA: TonB C-terminal domain-containing protein, partial [Verrucomicrobiae bacterium]|nr:TonB C-terminal domain-containing protein [Verrucomicrobiae bacterium]